MRVGGARTDQVVQEVQALIKVAGMGGGSFRVAYGYRQAAPPDLILRVSGAGIFF